MSLKRFIDHTDIKCAHPEEPLHACARKMKESDVGALPVVEDGQTVGVITDRDLVIRAMAEGRSNEDTVDNFMTTPPITIREDSNVDDLITLMEQEQVRRVVIERDGQAIGVVSSGDVEELLAEQFSKIVQGTCPKRGKLIRTRAA